MGRRKDFMKLTRHNGRSGKNGTYNPRHNDRRFDVGNSEHIDSGRVDRNVYWDCYRGFTTAENRNDPAAPDYTFEKIEQMYYMEHYYDFVSAQNERNEKTRHTERNRSMEDLLKNNKTCPEESIYQIGTVERSVPPDVLFSIANDFYTEFEQRFGSHVHILDWALHLDEGTPHIHERHVFDCANRYGEICPQQEKALEELGIPLPDPEKPKSRKNNRKQTFDGVCREMLFEIAKKYGLDLEKEPSYGGRNYLEKQDYILMKQKEKLQKQESWISQKAKRLETLTMKIEDVETLLDDVSKAAYDKAVEVVTDQVRERTQNEDIRILDSYQKGINSPNTKNTPQVVAISNKVLNRSKEKLREAATQIFRAVQTSMMKPESRKQGQEQVKTRAKESIMEMLEKGKMEADRLQKERQEQERQNSVAKRKYTER